MPVRKFRSIEEMKKDRGYDRDDPRLPRIIEGIWDFGRRTTRLRFPPGVHRYRTVEEMTARTAEWAEDNFRAFRARRDAERAGAHAEPAPTPGRG
ncbi:MAG: hypothetical protein KBB14_07950 [Thermoanaerobaculia bacterium]|jgi:hypothetical protein|nr:hypothetical protein [Thermoanaerobaculia bacterium]